MHRALAPFLLCLSFLLSVTASGDSSTPHSLLITGGTVYDGSGAAPVRADVAIRNDRIVAITRAELMGRVEHLGSGRMRFTYYERWRRAPEATPLSSSVTDE